MNGHDVVIGRVSDVTYAVHLPPSPGRARAVRSCLPARRMRDPTSGVWLIPTDELPALLLRLQARRLPVHVLTAHAQEVLPL